MQVPGAWGIQKTAHTHLPDGVVACAHVGQPCDDVHVVIGVIVLALVTEGSGAGRTAREKGQGEAARSFETPT